MRERTGYLPTLDGWRAIAVLMVILYHDALHAFGPLSTNWVQKHGVLGVDIFFGISGLLICSRLLEEESAVGGISLSNFYIRRAFRILPPALSYLAVAAVLGLLSILPLLPKEWFAALLLYRNYSRLSSTAGHIDWFTAHFWSLSIEEHFYLLLPSILVFLPKNWRLPALGAIVTVVAAWRIYRQQTRPLEFLWHHTDTRLDALLIPAMLAIVLAHPEGRALIKKICRFWFVPAAILVYMMSSEHFPKLTPILESFLIPLTLLGTVLYPGGIFARVLEWPSIRWLGKISYSLYLWQELFFLERFLPNYRPLGWMESFPARWGMLLACATASYYLVEKPMVKLGHRLAPPATPGRSEMVRRRLQPDESS
jgi:peptidoglycan/LPS O-acetylase OafA/YrhL